MTKVSSSVISLCNAFENFFTSSTQNGLPLPNPCAALTDAFLTTHDLNQLFLTCSAHHMSLVNEMLHEYCKLRIFHYIKGYNKAIKKNKKGSELNKDKKLNL